MLIVTDLFLPHLPTQRQRNKSPTLARKRSPQLGRPVRPTYRIPALKALSPPLDTCCPALSSQTSE